MLDGPEARTVDCHPGDPGSNPGQVFCKNFFPSLFSCDPQICKKEVTKYHQKKS